MDKEQLERINKIINFIDNFSEAITLAKQKGQDNVPVSIVLLQKVFSDYAFKLGKLAAAEEMLDSATVKMQQRNKAIHDIAPWLSASLSDPKTHMCDEYVQACEAIFSIDMSLNTKANETELPEDLKDPQKTLQRGRELLNKWGLDEDKKET